MTRRSRPLWPALATTFSHMPFSLNLIRRYASSRGAFLNARVSEEKFLIHGHKRNIMQDSLVEEMEGVEATGMDIDSPPLMTEQERRILEVYDRQEELQLEIALLKARGILSQGI
jgi:hypothetical protein